MSVIHKELAFQFATPFRANMWLFERGGAMKDLEIVCREDNSVELSGESCQTSTIPVPRLETYYRGSDSTGTGDSYGEAVLYVSGSSYYVSVSHVRETDGGAEDVVQGAWVTHDRGWNWEPAMLPKTAKRISSCKSVESRS